MMSKDKNLGISDDAVERKASVTDAAHRSQLSLYGALATQLLNPYGVSVLEDMSSIEHWNYMKNGTQSFEFQALGSVLAVRRELGLARAAETLTTTILALQNPTLVRWLDGSMLGSAMEEATSLQPILQILRGRRGSSAPPTSGSPLKKQRLSEDPEETPSPADLAKAARGFYTWLAEPKSVLRELIDQLSQGGAFYSGNVMAKTCLAWISHGSPPNLSPIAEADFVAVALSRGTPKAQGTPAVEPVAVEIREVFATHAACLRPSTSGLDTVTGDTATHVAKGTEPEYILDVASDTAHPMQGPATGEPAGSGSFAECAVTQQEPDDDLPATPTEPSLAEDAQPRSHAADGEAYGEYFDEASDYAMLHGSGSDHPSACCVVHPAGKNAGPLQGDDIHKGA